MKVVDKENGGIEVTIYDMLNELKKVIVRMDVPHSFYDDNGIFHCCLIDLLLGRIELF